MDPGPAFHVNPDADPDLDPIQIQGFEDVFFDKKIAIYFTLVLHKGSPSYRRSLQPSKRTSSTSKNEIY